MQQPPLARGVSAPLRARPWHVSGDVRVGDVVRAQLPSGQPPLGCEHRQPRSASQRLLDVRLVRVDSDIHVGVPRRQPAAAHGAEHAAGAQRVVDARGAQRGRRELEERPHDRGWWGGEAIREASLARRVSRPNAGELGAVRCVVRLVARCEGCGDDRKFASRPLRCVVRLVGLCDEGCGSRLRYNAASARCPREHYFHPNMGSAVTFCRSRALPLHVTCLMNSPSPPVSPPVYLKTAVFINCV